jgi:hypothetical protein
MNAKPPSLRHTLNLWEAVGVSVALMAPSMAININPQGTAAIAGRSAWRHSPTPRLTRKVPHVSAAACVAVVTSVQALAWAAFRATPFNLFLTSATAGTLILLVAYALATVVALRLLFFSRRRAVAKWEVAIPVLGFVLLGYTLYRTSFRGPAAARCGVRVWRSRH